MISPARILRDAYNAGSNVFFPGSVTSRAALASTSLLTADVLKKVIRTMERNNVPKFSDGFYHAVIDPETKFDLTADALWTDVAKYQNTANMERYEIGRMLSTKFYETTNAKTFQDQANLFGTTASLTIAAVDLGKKRLTVTANHALITPDVARELSGQLVKVGPDIVCIERVEPTDGTSAYIFLRWTKPGMGTATTITPTGGGASGLKVHSTLLYGADAFGTVALGGSGDSAYTIINPPGSSGALDPLNQRGTVDWRVKAFCGVILDDIRVCRIEHAVSG